MANTINLNDIPANRWQDTRYCRTTAASYCKIYGDGGDITVSDCVTPHGDGGGVPSVSYDCDEVIDCSVHLSCS